MVKCIRIREDYRLKVEAVLCAKGYSVSIKWDNVFLEKGNRKVPVACNIHGTASIRGVANLRLGQYVCDDCLSDKFNNVAAQKGFKLLSRPSQSEVELSCNTCSNTKITSLSALYPHSAGIQCDFCLQSKYSILSDNMGFNFVSKSMRGSQTRITIKCKKDQTEKAVSVAQLMTGSVQCIECRTNDHRRALAEKNCTFVQEILKTHKGSNRTRIEYKNSDGDIFEGNSTDILQGKFSTINAELGWCKALTKKGCIFISSIYKVNNKTRVAYKNQSGEVFYAAASNILEGKFATTKENYWYAQHSTYLIVSEFNGSTYCKIGTANVPEKRLKDLKLAGESIVFTLRDFPDRFGADHLESELHEEFKSFRLDPEIAKIFTGAVKNVRRSGKTGRVPIKDGITEYFTHEVYDILKTRYNLEGSANGS